jgi:uncharacterized damage-inducible protein DinB
MSSTLHDFLSAATQNAAEELVTAYQRIPDDQQRWRAEGKGRSALDQVIECTLLNGYTADLIQNRHWAEGAMETFTKDKAEAEALDWDVLHSNLLENTRRVIAALQAVPESDLQNPIQMPWRTQSLAEIMAYPYWNMSYHQGQINYIASLLGCLD